MPDAANRMVHAIDRHAGGSIEVSEVVTNPETRTRYVVSSLTEEAHHVQPARGRNDDAGEGEGDAANRESATRHQ